MYVSCNGFVHCNSCAFPWFMLKIPVYYSTNMIKLFNFILPITAILVKTVQLKYLRFLSCLLNYLILYNYFWPKSSFPRNTIVFFNFLLDILMLQSSQILISVCNSLLQTRLYHLRTEVCSILTISVHICIFFSNKNFKPL